MQRLPYASGNQFFWAYTRHSSAPGLIGAAIIIAYFSAILDLGADGWRVFWTALAALTLLSIPCGQWFGRRVTHAVVETLDRIHAGTATRGDLTRAYAATRTIPHRGQVVQIATYLLAAVFIPTWMSLAQPDVGGFTLLVIAVASLSGGAATLPFVRWVTQKQLAPVRAYFARQLSTEERAAEESTGSLAITLAFPMVSAAGAAVAFIALLGYSVALDMLESHDVRLKQAMLEAAVPGYRTNPASLRHLIALSRDRKIAEDMFVARAAEAHGTGSLTPREVAWLRREPNGTSIGLDSASSFAWRQVDEGVVLVAASPVETLVGEVGDVAFVVAIVLAGVMAVALVVPLLVAADTRRVAEGLRAQAQRIGAGDFTETEIVECDDEFSAVASAFAVMRRSLGETIARVSASAASVDRAAGELVKIGGLVRDVTAAQVKGIERANGAVAFVNRQASDITSSAQELIGGVEEASSSVLELGAASEELNQTTIALNTQVEAVAGSIDQMVRSVALANEASEALGAAVTDTNSSVAQMARTMQSVDAHAWETARLSTRVVELADGGRDRVQETIRGMEVIRDATDSANRVITGLAERMQEIGAIVDVIDDIADETNLLALNAAIIAAQAGDQGRAFSVVADEIKDLADRVLTNTKEIGGLIRSVQSESRGAAEAIQSGAERAQSGVDLSAQAGVALEEITGAARHAGDRIQEIVQAMREQTRAASHVEQLTLGVSQRVEQIRGATREQSRGNEVVMRGSLVMRDVAQQTQRTTEEQTRGALRIRDSIEGVREAVDRIHASLQQQNESCGSAAASLADVFARTRTHDEATDQLSAAAGELQQLAASLREDLKRFRVGTEGALSAAEGTR
jgi:methyl-accepting chemotaxis protein